MFKFALLAAALASIPSVLAQAPLYGQCGGTGWSGPTTCASGSTCVKSNDYYSQCLPGSSTQQPTSSTQQPGGGSTSTTSTSTAPGSSGVCGAGSRTKFKYLGVNEAGAEFGQDTIPGVLGTHYTWPSPSSIDYFVNQGQNTFRVAFLVERLSPPATGLTGAFNAAYLNGLKTIVNYITGKGAYAVIDPHNFLRYNGQVLTNASQFQAWWQKLATEFKSNSHVIFDLQNEPNGIDASVVASVMQAGLNGVRAAGATQLVLVEGTAWSGAWSWTSSSGNAAAFANIKDSANNFAIEMHQYLDSDSSGTSANCVSASIGQERVANATAWLQQKGYKGFLGEYGGGNNAVCQQAIQRMLCDLQKTGVWIGALFWSAGPWWDTYFQSIEPPNGAALPLLQYIKAATA